MANKTPEPYLEQITDTASNTTDIYCLTYDLLDVGSICHRVKCDEAGAISTFIGKAVVSLEYEAYGEMAVQEMKSIVEEMRATWEVHHVAIFHKLGSCPVGENSIVIAVSSAHRRNALESVEFLIDQLKARVPIWKKEVYDNETSVWKKNSESIRPSESIRSSEITRERSVTNFRNMELQPLQPSMEGILKLRSKLLSDSWSLHFCMLRGAYLRFSKRALTEKEAEWKSIWIKEKSALGMTDSGYLNERFCQVELLPNSQVSRGEFDEKIINVNDGVLADGKLASVQLSCSLKNVSQWEDALHMAKYSQGNQQDCGDLGKLLEFACAMKNGIKIKDRMYYLKVFTECFIGTEATEWIRKTVGCTVPQAVAIGDRMLNCGLIHHVTFEHPFCNHPFFYRFSDIVESIK